MQEDVRNVLREIAGGTGKITVLTGAGISAESGIPTFRGPEGYWTVGSTVYQPQEMATFHMFCQMPDEVWKWYLYRMGICGAAEPNPGHLALVAMEQHFGDRFTLITQNVDGLHLRAGNTLPRTYQIHGNVFYMRCSLECSEAFYPIPAAVRPKSKEEGLTDSDREHLRCPLCGARSRPHILLFDESYNEHHYHFYSSLKTAQNTALLIVVGTAGATNLPNQVAREVYQRDGVIIDVNIEANPFTQLAQKSARGFFVQEPSASALPALLEAMIAA
ncbi:Sir2 family NAD-dependent protein deacetylase [uncultured Desulfobulbus sp.]|uniref:SIR2 family NAD-dependent protein deacylase n=1 Tax=uncultured Desulfobulbus sp. TaxID=239745 RepID=UPI0029C71E74|nr:Sir2 family NAD-dependent protein deacetylase [uncultured Desulfobulbus sp.]